MVGYCNFQAGVVWWGNKLQHLTRKSRALDISATTNETIQESRKLTYIFKQHFYSHQLILLTFLKTFLKSIVLSFFKLYPFGLKQFHIYHLQMCLYAHSI